MDKQNRTGVERLVLPGNTRDICESNRDLVMKGENDMKRPEFIITVTIGETREERPQEPEEDLKEIWKQVEEKAMEKLNRVYKAVEDRNKEALDKTHKEYFNYLTTLSRTTGIELIQLDNHFGNLYWTKK